MLIAIEHGLPLTERTEASDVYKLDVGKVEYYWPHIERELDEEPELWEHWYTKAGIFERLFTEHMQAWVVCEKDGPIRALLFTQVLLKETGNVLQCWWARGFLSPGALSNISDAFDRFGAHHDCIKLSVVGRPGWTRALRGLGMKPESVTLSRPIYPTTRH